MIFYENAQQATIAREIMNEMSAVFDSPIVTAVEPAQTFYPAEEYHQGYYDRVGARNTYCTFVITP